MNAENRRRVQAAVKDAGEALDGKLPSMTGLTRRNPWAHVWERIMDRFGCSYRDVDDDRVEEVLELIAWLRENPC